MPCWPKKAPSRLTLPKTAEAFAPAKVNLTLHVTGQRGDGYHLLDSLVVFAGVGDKVRAEARPVTTLRVTGPRAAGVPPGEDNLVLRAAKLARPAVSAAITLTKILPAAAGIGGGSSDAAACLRVLSRLSGGELPDDAALVTLGADVPACVRGGVLRMRGVGDRLDPWPALPPLWLVLVNPGVAVPTPQVFKALARRDNTAMTEPFPQGHDLERWLAWLSQQRNDLQAPAISIAPVIGDVLARVADTEGCALSRMSGSGATVFGVYVDQAKAEAAAHGIAQDQPGWWCVAAPVLT